MTINERMRYIRKDRKLTQVDFAAKLKISGQAVSLIEKGINNPSDQTISLICREFNVNETWLRTGEGEPYHKPATIPFAEYAKERNMTAFEEQFVWAWLELPEDVREMLIRHFRERLGATVSPVTPTKAQTPPKTREQIAEEEAEAIKRRILEANLTKGKTTPVSGTPRSGSGIA